MVRMRPCLSLNRPTHGLNAYIPAMCSEITYELTVSWPCDFRCTGVMVITATIVICEMIIDATASVP